MLHVRRKASALLLSVCLAVLLALPAGGCGGDDGGMVVDSGPDAPPGACVGTAGACADSLDSCDVRPGCATEYGCVGTPADTCFDPDPTADCDAGCYENTTTGYCDGIVPWTCEQRSEFSCNAHNLNVCAWVVVACGGIAEVCDSLTFAQCSSHPDCNWQ